MPLLPMQQQQMVPSQPPQMVLQHDQTAGTSLNVAIHDAKDFPADITPELYSELAMADGRALFECPSLVKATGIDLMNCPLTVVLKLRVRRRMPPQDAMILWHVVLPLPVIGKYLLQAPHEWETWIGLFPYAQNLEAYDPSTMFTQSMHLISRPDAPKLRLRFTYHNPQLQAQISAQCEMQQQETRRRMELTQQVGRAQFEEIHKLTRTLRDSSVGDSTGTSSAVASSPSQGVSSDAVGSTPGRTEDCAFGIAAGSREAACPQQATPDQLLAALGNAMDFITSVRQLLANDPSVSSLPAALAADEVVCSVEPGRLLEAHCSQLYQCLCAAGVSGGGSHQGDSREQFAILLAQQRQALQLNFDTQISSLKQQLEEARHAARDREGENAKLQAQLNELMRQQHTPAA